MTGRSWEWLSELCRPLDLDVQLLDITFRPLLTRAGRAGQRSPLGGEGLRRLRPAVEACIDADSPQVAEIADRQVAVSPLRSAARVVGALLIAPRGNTGPMARSTLATVSSWLRAAVEQHLASHAVGVDHVSALHRALQDALVEESDRRLVAVFAEALAVWYDIDVVGYVETAPGVFVRSVSLGGHRSVDPPLVFPPAAVPTSKGLVRLPQTQVDSGDNDTDVSDTLVVALSPSGEPAWLLTLAGAVAACQPTRLDSYVSALDLALGLATRAASARLGLAVSADLESNMFDRREGLQRALDRIRRSLAAEAVGFAAHGVDDEQILAAHSGSDCSPASRSQRLLVERRIPNVARLTLEIEHVSQMGWTPGERAQARAAADVLEAWVARQVVPAPEPPAPSTEPAPRSLTTSIAEHATRVLRRGDVLSVAVFSCAPAPRADEAEVLVVESKRQLRDSDVIDLLPSGDIAVLMPQATAPEAPAVARRVRAALARAAAGMGISIVGEGLATRLPGQGEADPVEEARWRARGRSSNAR